MFALLLWMFWADARAHLGSANQLMQAERYAEAAVELEQALRDDPRLHEPREQLAICYFETRDYAHAGPLFEKLLPSKRALYYLARIDLVEGRLESAIRRFRSIPQADPVRDELYYLGAAYYKQERYRQATEALDRAAAQNPRDSRIHQLLARAYQKLGESKRAEQEFAETRRLKDYYLEGSVAIGRCRGSLIQGRVDEAWSQCKPLLNTDDVDKIVAIGMLFGQAKQYPQALDAWEKAVALDPDSSEIQHNLALTCFHLKNAPCARGHAEEAVRLRPDFVEANILYGTILYMGAEDEWALKVLSRAHELKPDDSSVRRLLVEELSIAADRLAKQRNWKQAAELLERARVIDPGSPLIASRLAEIRARAAAQD